MKPRTNNNKIEPQIAKHTTIQENVRIVTHRVTKVKWLRTMYHRVRQQSRAIRPSEMVRMRYGVAVDEKEFVNLSSLLRTHAEDPAMQVSTSLDAIFFAPRTYFRISEKIYSITYSQGLEANPMNGTIGNMNCLTTWTSKLQRIVYMFTRN